MSEGIRKIAGVCVAVCLLASCAGSESGSDGREEIRAAVTKLQRAFAAEDTERVCALLSRAGRRHVAAMGHGSEGPCHFDLYMFIEGVQKSRTWRDRTMRAVTDIDIDGDRATAKVQFEDGQTATVPLVDERGEWRVDALYGGIPAAQQEDNY